MVTTIALYAFTLVALAAGMSAAVFVAVAIDMMERHGSSRPLSFGDVFTAIGTALTRR